MPNNNEVFRTGINVNANARTAVEGILKNLEAELSRMGSDQLKVSVGVDVDKATIEKQLKSVTNLIQGLLKNLKFDTQFPDLFKDLSNSNKDINQAVVALGKLHNALEALSKLPKAEISKLPNLSAKRMQKVLSDIDTKGADAVKIRASSPKASSKNSISVKVEPDVDPASFISEVQKKISAAGKPVKVDVSVGNVQAKSKSTGSNASGKTSTSSASDVEALSKQLKQYDGIIGKMERYVALQAKIASGETLGARDLKAFAKLDAEYNSAIQFLQTYQGKTKEAKAAIDSFKDSFNQAFDVARQSSLSKMGGELSAMEKVSDKYSKDYSERIASLKNTVSEINSIGKIDATNLEAVSNIFSRLGDATKGFSDINKNLKSFALPTVESEVSKYERLIESLNTYYDLLNKIRSGKGVTVKQQDQFADLDRTYNELTRLIQESKTGLNSLNIPIETVNELSAAFQRATENYKIFAQESKSNPITGHMSQLDNYYAQSADKSPELVGVLDSIQAKVNELRAMGPIELLDDAEVPTWVQLDSEIKKALADLKATVNQYNALDPKRLNDLRVTFKNFLNRNDNALSDSSLRNLAAEIEVLFNTAIWQKDFDVIQQKVSSFQNQVVSLNKTGQSFGTIWSDKMRSMVAWMASFGTVYDVINKAREGVQAIIEYDTALTNLGKVADESTAKLREFGQAAYDVANGIGATNIAVIDAAGEWARLGYSIEEAGELAKASTIYANVGELPSDEATKTLVSAMKAFELEADEAMRISDILNEVGNKYAVSSAELGDILQRSSAAMATAGESLEGVVALGTGAQEIVQNAENVGFKFLLPKHTVMYGVTFVA